MSEPREEPARRGRVRRVLGSVWLRVTVTAALLAIVAEQIDWSTLGSRLSNGNPAEFALAVALQVVAYGVGAWRWQLLLRAAGLVLDVPRLLRVYAISMFSNTFLPSNMGGDLARTLLVARRGPQMARAALSVVVDRAAAFAGLIGLAWLAYALDPDAVPAGATTFLVWVTVVCVAGTAVAALTILRGGGAVRRLVPARLLSTARDSHAVLQSYARAPAVMAVVVLASVVFQALVAVQLVLLASAIGVDLPLATAAVALALVTVVTLIPLSIGGFGVREASYVVLLGGASIAATEATLISLLSVAALFLASLPGAWLLARGGIAPALGATQT